MGLFLIIKVLAIDLRNAEQRLHAIAAAGILAAQEFKLSYRVLERFLIVKGAAVFDHQLAKGDGGRIGFRRSGSGVIDLAIGVHHTGVVAFGAGGFGLAVESLAKAFRGLKLGARNLLLLRDGPLGERRGRKKEGGDYYCKCTCYYAT